MLECCLLLLPAAVMSTVPTPHPHPTPPHSVSGFSAGASIAVNHFIAYSDITTGLGIIGGSPYGCYLLPDSLNICSGFVSNGSHLENTTAPWDQWVDGDLAQYLAGRERNGEVAPLANLKGKPVYLFSGLDDVWVYQSVMRGVERQFRGVGSKVKTEFSYYAAHSWVVDSQTCRDPGMRPATAEEEHAACCGLKGSSDVGTCGLDTPYHPKGCCGVCSQGDQDDRVHPRKPFTVGWRPPINSCDYDMTGEILRWVYGEGEVLPRKPVVPTNLFSVNQSAYLPPGSNWTAGTAWLDEVGLVYVPKACKLKGAGGDREG
eukprot:Hpha_TRINITY_DN1881_c0_g2::TRINITY_DN1881_c0_g2_i1::g.170550::m.170550